MVRLTSILPLREPGTSSPRLRRCLEITTALRTADRRHSAPGHSDRGDEQKGPGRYCRETEARRFTVVPYCRPVPEVWVIMQKFPISHHVAAESASAPWDR